MKSDLFICQYGYEKCDNGHSFGPAVRDHYLIHFIRSGKGFFKIDEKVFELEAGNGFLICPNDVTYYKANDYDPWEYSWIGFDGESAKEYLIDANLTFDNPIFSYKTDDFISNCFDKMVGVDFNNKNYELKQMAHLYLFLDKLIESNSDLNSKNFKPVKDIYITYIINYVEMNFSRKISLIDLSNTIGLNRCYMNTIFKNQFGISIQQYLIDFRIKKSIELMKNTNLLISDISRSVGYDDPLLFSKTFKKNTNLTPTEFRKKLEN